MNRTLYRIAIVLLLSGILACKAPAPKQPEAAAPAPKQPEAAAPAPARWPIPAGWTPIPVVAAVQPGFLEGARSFASCRASAAPDNWSYDFVWWLDQPPPFDATSLAATLTTYFRGLATEVGGAKYKFDDARYRTVLTPVPGSQPPRLTGQVFTYDAFKTGLPLTLNVEAELRSCPSTKQFAIVMSLSPKDTTDSGNHYAAASTVRYAAIDA
jgi:hypothetical protein